MKRKYPDPVNKSLLVNKDMAKEMDDTAKAHDTTFTGIIHKAWALAWDKLKGGNHDKGTDS